MAKTKKTAVPSAKHEISLTKKVWNMADVLMGLMALINLPVILILGGPAIRAMKDYMKQKKEGKDPVFKARDIELRDKTDFWN